ncbi:MAG TPA: SLC13 family permease [Mariprofundaceae bacterium]|nr:SLC13 family permease [Mariprofundaceae bacterium]
MSLTVASRIAGPVVGLLAAWLLEIPGHPHAAAMLAIAVWMAIWWLSECVPLALTSLLPLLAFPLAGIAGGGTIASEYVNSVIFLFIGGFLIAQAMENTRLHQRIALVMLSRFHASPMKLAVGFALATAFLSMWISNTATAMLMVTIAVPLLRRLAEEHGPDAMAPVTGALLLVIAYSASLGGMATPVGSPPNLVFLETMRANLPAMTPSFLQWMLVGLPLTVIGLTVMLLVLRPKLAATTWQKSGRESVMQALEALGAMRREEKLVAWVLGITALLWMTRTGIRTDSFDIPGWAALLPYKGVDDGTVAMLGAATLFLLPGREKRPILGSDAFGRLPWDIVLLFGGGFALAYGMQHSGLSQWLGEVLGVLGDMPVWLLLLAVALTITFLTEISSNTATAQVMLPILVAVAAGNRIDPMLLLLPATLSASCAFMLPVATPPNAIIFGTHQVPMALMARTGLKMNLLMALVIVTLVYLLRPLLPAG